MKNVLIILALIFTNQTSAADWTADRLSYTQANLLARNIAIKALENSDSGKLQLTRTDRLANENARLIVVSKVTRGFSPDGSYQHAYRYICRQSRHFYRGKKLDAALCGEMDYRIRVN